MVVWKREQSFSVRDRIRAKSRHCCGVEACQKERAHQGCSAELSLEEVTPTSGLCDHLSGEVKKGFGDRVAELMIFKESFYY